MNMLMPESHRFRRKGSYQMNNTAAFLCLAIFVFTAKNALADDSSGGMVEMDVTGTVVAAACDIDEPDQNQPISLGSFSSSTFKTIDDTSAASNLLIHLTDCSSASSGVKVTFSGTADSDNPQLLALSDTSNSGGMASGVGIEVLDGNKKTVPINTASDVISLDGSDATLTFFLRYKATKIPVNPGNASSIMYFDMAYQ